jgi:hypothetical protein
MALITGTPVGNLIASQDLFLDVPPTFYFQENKDGSGNAVGLLNNPDGDNFFHGLSGTTANPVFEGGCYENFVFTDVRDINMIRCDTDGDKGSIQRRNHLTVTFTLKQMFKLTKLRHMLNLGPVTTTVGATEKVGIGQIDNTKDYYIYFPSVYDSNTGDFLTVTLFNAQFTLAWAMSFTYAQPATVTIQATGFADPSKPSAQLFASIIRADPSAI